MLSKAGGGRWSINLTVPCVSFPKRLVAHLDHLSDRRSDNRAHGNYTLRPNLYRANRGSEMSLGTAGFNANSLGRSVLGLEKELFFPLSFTLHRETCTVKKREKKKKKSLFKIKLTLTAIENPLSLCAMRCHSGQIFGHELFVCTPTHPPIDKAMCHTIYCTVH